MRARKGVAGDFFSAFDTFEKEGVTGALGDAQIGADGSQQIRGKNVVDRDEVTLFRETLEFAVRGSPAGSWESVHGSDRVPEMLEAGRNLRSTVFSSQTREAYYCITSGWPGLFVGG